MSEELNSNFSTLYLIAIKELRMEKNIHQGVLAQSTGKSPSAWNKVENGQTTLTVDAFVGACYALQMSPVAVLNIVERLVPMFNMRTVLFHAAPLEAGDDQLLPLVVQYFASKGLEAMRSRMADRHVGVSHLGNPFAQSLLPSVVAYCSDKTFKNWMDSGAPVGSQPFIVSPIPISAPPAVNNYGF